MGFLRIGHVDFAKCGSCLQPNDAVGECPMTEDDVRIEGSDLICTLYLAAPPAESTNEGGD